jgi:AraC family transcriptional regulator, regulatory protein of adaptative response / methylated-DNA-[protein]-cysteine methyltransferase
MNLMIPETRLQHTSAATHTDFTVDILYYATGECALGRVLVARSVNGVCAILIGADHDELEGEFAARFPRATLVTNEAIVHDDLAKVIRFVDKPAEGFHLTLDMRGTPLERRVWEKLRAIPVGRTVTYMELARASPSIDKGREGGLEVAVAASLQDEYLPPEGALCHLGLDGDRALDRVHHAGEFGENAVAGSVDDAPAELAYHREHDRLMPLEIMHRACLVRAHQRTVAGDICG